GSPLLAEEYGFMTPAVADEVERLEKAGSTALIVGLTGENPAPIGVIGVADRVRPGAAAAVDRLKALGVRHLVMLTGDNERTAEAVAASVGLSEYRARLLPQDKIQVIEELRERYGSVAMVGDGINDAPALARADIGIAMGAAGSDTALETADVALMSDDLGALPSFLGLGRRTVANIRQNVWVSVGVKAIVLVAAVAGYAPLWLAVFADTGVALLVILNGLRLLRAGRFA
ncbi:MAG: HAD-IC family P-type ATPase, partial [Coriobacteriia bacterium]|nr:HAD-IC family P-type ATPase [Coriobacteriia bacterium]